MTLNDDYIPYPRKSVDIRKHLKRDHKSKKTTWAPARHAILHEEKEWDHHHRRIDKWEINKRRKEEDT